ncbi:MAG: beta-ketoacyl-ACP synthase [Halofilum sp. (in: g-proteobacteria)]
MHPHFLTASTLVSAIGRGREATLRALHEERGGLAPIEVDGLALHAATVDGLDEVALPGELARFDCRNHRLAEAALATDAFEARVAAAVARHGRERIGVFLATSTSGMWETEDAYRAASATGALAADFTWKTTHQLSALSDFVRLRLGLGGPAVLISTACSSSAKAFASAARYIDAGLCDAAVVGGVDSLCRNTMFGFHSLELTAAGPCRPFAQDRDGMCLGEAAAFALLESEAQDAGDIALLGYGESADAHHMSTPHPEAAGARLAMHRALERAGIGAERIDYINLHGTATPSNDAAEDLAVTAEIGTATPASSTKGWTGHTLGAAGAVEALICTLALEHGFIPPTLSTRQVDRTLRCDIVTERRERPINLALNNSFGFGGNNCTLVLGRSA